MKDTITEIYNQLSGILDKDYFHIYVGETVNSEIEWKVYFKNLTIEDYYSNKNECLLSSGKNTTNDVYILASNFLREKRNILESQRTEILLKEIDFSFSTMNLSSYIDFIISLLVCIGFTVAMIINICTGYKWGLWQNIIMITSLLIAKIIIDHKIEKFKEEQKNKYVEEHIKTYIKGMGLQFVERIKLK